MAMNVHIPLQWSTRSALQAAVLHRLLVSASSLALLLPSPSPHITFLHRHHLLLAALFTRWTERQCVCVCCPSFWFQILPGCRQAHARTRAKRGGGCRGRASEVTSTLCHLHTHAPWARLPSGTLYLTSWLLATRPWSAAAAGSVRTDLL